MLILGLILNILGIGLFCWLIFTLAVYALPFFVALSVAQAAINGGASIAVAAFVAILAGILTLVTGQTAFLPSLDPALLRAMIAAAFAVPATVAGYHVVHGISQVGVASLLWRDAFAWIGAIAVRQHGLGTDGHLCRAPGDRSRFCRKDLSRLLLPRRSRDEPLPRPARLSAIQALVGRAIDHR
ncbi:hypothetical protein [Bradyrhizobium cenepequi]|uniref:hypothetical protein n=1 Tax=Bradyrhizobium cenepequi TaxID=2821403 RepID=UPI001CE23861|nr:hypothetical protein [Bradyrhizobium cenepequi]